MKRNENQDDHQNKKQLLTTNENSLSWQHMPQTKIPHVMFTGLVDPNEAAQFHRVIILFIFLLTIS
jgi:hypothetical protein